jgi:hypothetical protein
VGLHSLLLTSTRVTSPRLVRSHFAYITDGLLFSYKCSKMDKMSHSSVTMKRNHKRFHRYSFSLSLEVRMRTPMRVQAKFHVAVLKY